MAEVVDAVEPSPVYLHRVRYHETDAQGIVFNARYWEFFDVAMTEYFAGLGWSYRQMIGAGLDPSLVHAEIDFHRSAVFEDELAVGVQCVRVGRSSFSLRFAVRRDGALLTTATIVYVNLEPVSQSSRPIPATIREQLLARCVPDDQ